MATPQQTRIALAEIPDRLEALRVAHTPTNANRRTPDEPTPAATTPHLMLVDNVMNVTDFLFSPRPSPDELIIRQRGRRRFTTTFSPDKSLTIPRSPFQRTPTKNLQLTNGMILRSSPRKRLTMGSTPPDPLPMDSHSPNKINAPQQLWPETPSVKKLRLLTDERPIAQTSNEVQLSVLLQGISKEQLINLIMCNVNSDDPETTKKNEDNVRAQLPLPDISGYEQDLIYAKRLIFKSLPTSRLCKKTDAAAYSKAALHLNEFRRILQTQAKCLHDSSHWDALLDYVTMAWKYVASTPNWESSAHNAVRRQCFKVLTCYCISSVKYGGLRLGPTRLDALEKNLRDWSKDYEDVMSCINVLQKMLSKGRTSL